VGVDEPSAYAPYRWAAADFQLGLRPARPDQWVLRSRNYPAIMREKRARLRDRERFYRTLPQSLDVQRELSRRVVAHLVADHAGAFVLEGRTLVSCIDGACVPLDEGEPLWQLSQVIEEDFMLLQELRGTLTITATSNAYSSSGRLVAAVGHDVSWAHIPVPTLTDKLGPRISRVLATVHESTPCERFNWQVTPMATLFFPHGNPHEANAQAMRSVLSQLRERPERAGELLYIRVERQTLSRLPESRGVAFSLHTYSDPLSSLESDPGSASAMLGLLEAYAEDRWRYSEMDIVREPLLAYLRSVAATAG
jgi:dimethylamine monooxygenase subunit A